MNRFVFNRAALLTMGLTIALSCQSLGGMQAAYADASWGDILKPLVRDVIIPGASAVAKKVAKKMGTTTPATESTNSAATTETPADSSSPEVVIVNPEGGDATTPTPDGPAEPYAITQDSEADLPPPPPAPPRESPLKQVYE